MPPLRNKWTNGHAEPNGSLLSGSYLKHDPLLRPQASDKLLAALRSLIIPLVQSLVPFSKDLDKVQLGPEADSFLVALQSYIASIIPDQSQSNSQVQEGIRRRTVNLADIDIETTSEMQAMNKTNDLKESEDGRLQLRPMKIEYNNFSIARSPHLEANPLQLGVAMLLDEGLTSLRMHVFNKMPIRLLCFQKRGAELDITLLDRPGVYSFLAQKLPEEIKKAILSSWGHQSSYISKAVSVLAKYAILSHTWLHSAPGEVTYYDWQNGTFDSTHAGYRKLIRFCKIAAEEHGFALGWMDTVCINKASSAELDESIRSMYRWYQNAGICITYLAETKSLSDMDDFTDPWFTRGWTLQELLAPRRLKFYGKDWNKLIKSSSNDKWNEDMKQRIELATTITKQEQDMALNLVPISRRMQWAAKRQVSREEDSAYSLMGLFGVNMSIAYGEGAEHAFSRLLKEILSMSKSDALDILNWGGHYNSETSLLLPSSPLAYLQRSERIPPGSQLIEPLMLTHLGLRVPVLILPATVSMLISPSFLEAWEQYYECIGDFYSTVYPNPSDAHEVVPTYKILDVKAFDPSLSYSDRYAFAVLNCEGDEMNISIPATCFAVVFKYRGDITLTPLTVKEKIPTERPINFQLFNIARIPSNKASYSIKRSELGQHRMQFLNMYF